MSYYDNQESVANIYVGLIERGWKCYGYKADQSDSMTDYWSPARWEGIATKDGYVLLVDVYGTSQSGYKKTKQGYTPDYEKISKLNATINDKAASQNEKESSQKIIDSILNKQKESTIIIEEYPVFTQGNPKGCNWHIEKDGNIIAKGKGAYQCDGYLFGNYREETMKKVNAFIDKIESKIAGTEQLEPVQEKVITKVIKPIETPVNVNDFIKDQTIIKLNSNFTGGHYKGELLQLIEVHTYNNKTLYTFVKLGKKYQQLKRYGAANNTLMLEVKNIEKWITEGTILTMELGEVEEITYKTVFKKVNRKAQESNLLKGETTEQNESIENNQTINNSDNITVEMKLNDQQKGIELYFNGKPNEGTRKLLKENGFHWNGKKLCWFTKQNEKSILFAEGFVSAYNEPIENEVTEQPITNEVPEAVEFETVNNESIDLLKVAKNDQILISESNLINRKVFGQWGINAGWDNGTITGETIYNEVIIKWEDGHQEYINTKYLIIVGENTSLDPVGVYLMPIENNEPTNDNTEVETVTEETNEPIQNDYKGKCKVLDFNSKFKAKQQENERIQALDYFTNNVLPYLSYEDKIRLLEAQGDKEQFNAIMYELMLKSKAEQLKQK
jgi:hypothetical protein